MSKYYSSGYCTSNALAIESVNVETGPRKLDAKDGMTQNALVPSRVGFTGFEPSISFDTPDIAGALTLANAIASVGNGGFVVQCFERGPSSVAAGVGVAYSLSDGVIILDSIEAGGEQAKAIAKFKVLGYDADGNCCLTSAPGSAIPVSILKFEDFLIAFGATLTPASGSPVDIPVDSWSINFNWSTETKKTNNVKFPMLAYAVSCSPSFQIKTPDLTKDTFYAATGTPAGEFGGSVALLLKHVNGSNMAADDGDITITLANSAWASSSAQGSYPDVMQLTIDGQFGRNGSTEALTFAVST